MDAVHTAERLKELQALPLSRKIQITQTRIIEWYIHFGGNVCVSFSGGKDSTVLLHIARQIYPDIPAVFSNTGLEYPEIQRFVRGMVATPLTVRKRFLSRCPFGRNRMSYNTSRTILLKLPVCMGKSAGSLDVCTVAAAIGQAVSSALSVCILKRVTLGSKVLLRHILANMISVLEEESGLTIPSMYRMPRNGTASGRTGIRKRFGLATVTASVWERFSTW